MLLYGDTFDGCYAQPEPSLPIVNDLPLDIQNWAFPLTQVQGNAGITSRGFPYVTSGTLSEREVVFRSWRAPSGSSTDWLMTHLHMVTKNTSSLHVIGAAFKWRAFNSGLDSGIYPIFAWNEGLEYDEQNAYLTTPQALWESTGLLWVDGHLEMGGVQSAGALPEDNYAFIEVVLDPLNGKGSVFVNNIAVISDVTLTGLTDITKIGAIQGFPRKSGGYPALGRYHHYDNIYILDDTGATMNQRLGPVAFRRMPLLAASSLAFSPVNVGTNLAAVNKNDLDTSTFNRSPGSNDVGDHFTVDTSALDPDIEILGVIANGFAAKTDLGERGLELVVTENSQQVRKKFPDIVINYAGLGELMFLPKAPDDTAWTLDKLDLMTVGYEVKEQ